MEDKQRLNNQNITVVNKGLFYGLWIVISFPFIMLGKFLKFVWGLIMTYFNWYKESNEIEKKRKELRKYLNIKRNDNEVV